MASNGGAAPAPMTGSRLERVRARAVGVVDTVPAVGRMLSELVRVELVDRSVVVAAQSLFALVPLLLVASAFAPSAVQTGVVEQLGSLLGIAQRDLEGVQQTVSAEEVRAQTGLVGVVIVLISASSFARSLQRLFERVWESPHRGGLVAYRRSLGWIAACVVYLQVLALLLSVLTGFPGSSLLRLAGQVAASTLLWWWSARVLLHGREPWSNLWPGALLTAVGMAVLTRGSQVLMPPYVQSNVEQFGPLGLIFAVSTWLLIFGGIVVVASMLGRIAVEDPGLRHLWEVVTRRRLASRPRMRGARR
jgi:membrane protein